MGAQALEVLQSLDAWQVVSIPRQPHSTAVDGSSATDGEPDLGLAQRMAALTSAFHAGGPLAFGWIRPETAGPVTVLVAGAALAAGHDAGQVLLTVPAGARGVSADRLGTAGPVEAIGCWKVIGGTCDWLLAGSSPRGPGMWPAAAAQAGGSQPPAGQEPGRGGIRPGLDDGLLAVWPGQFGWLVMAEPITASELAKLSSEASAALAAAQNYDSPNSRIAVRRLEGRHSELRQATATGLWSIRLLAGGADERAAAQVAGLLCACWDLDGLPYALTPLPGAASLAQTVSTGDLVPVDGGVEEQDVDPAPAATFSASTALLAALTRPPAREVPGVRYVLRPGFDVTPEPADETDGQAAPGESLADGAAADHRLAGGGVPLGTVLDRYRIPAGSVSLPGSSLNRHVFVCGATGSGKSQTIRGLLESATRAGVPWLVIEPAKAEYQLMAARLPGTEIIRIGLGEPGQPPAGLNPLEPAVGPAGTRFPLQAHADLVRALFLACFEAEEPFPQVLAAALTRCYTSAGWDLALGELASPGTDPAYPTLEDLEDAAEQVVDEIGYGREVTANVRGFIRIRVSSLRLGTAGRFLAGGHPLDLAALMRRNVVLQIENVGDDQDKAFLMGAVLIRLAGFLRMRHRELGPAVTGLRHLTVIEEAHRLLRNPGVSTGPAAHAVEMFADLLAEVRAYGEGLIIAEQIPAKLIPDVIKNTAVKIVHRLPAADDRDAVGATMNITAAQSQYLVTLPPGEAGVFRDGMDYPVLARMPDGTARETAAPAVTASAAAIIGRRSASCGPHCREVPCTQRQMRAAQRAADVDPRIIVWAELSVLAHLTGWTMPMPGLPFATALSGLEARLRDCALSHAVDAAVASRVSAISFRISPASLAAHITAAMRAALDEQRWLCDRAEPAYLAPCYRWALVLDSLTAYQRNHADAGRHPDSADWEAAYGQPVPGANCAGQLAAVQRWHAASQADRQAVRTVAFGNRTPAAIEHAIGTRATSDDWDQRLADALTTFHDCRWPADYLRPGS
jgi:uncharacterized protein